MQHRGSGGSPPHGAIREHEGLAAFDTLPCCVTLPLTGETGRRTSLSRWRGASPTAGSSPASLIAPRVLKSPGGLVGGQMNGPWIAPPGPLGGPWCLEPGHPAKGGYPLPLPWLPGPFRAPCAVLHLCIGRLLAESGKCVESACRPLKAGGVVRCRCTSTSARSSSASHTSMRSPLLRGLDS